MILFCICASLRIAPLLQPAVNSDVQPHFKFRLNLQQLLHISMLVKLLPDSKNLLYSSASKVKMPLMKKRLLELKKLKRSSWSVEEFRFKNSKIPVKGAVFIRQSDELRLKVLLTQQRCQG